MKGGWDGGGFEGSVVAEWLKSSRSQVWHLLCELPPVAPPPLWVLPTRGALNDKERILSSAPRRKHGRERKGLRQGGLPKTAQHDRKGFWNLVWIQKPSLCIEADSRLKKTNLLLWFSYWIYSCSFSPSVFPKGPDASFLFSRRENREA